jgi:hypothetical protein
LAAAQSAYASLQNNLQSAAPHMPAQSMHGGHHPHASASATDETTAETALTTAAGTASTQQVNGSAKSSTATSNGGLDVLA